MDAKNSRLGNVILRPVRSTPTFPRSHTLALTIILFQNVITKEMPVLKHGPGGSEHRLSSHKKFKLKEGEVLERIPPNEVSIRPRSLTSCQEHFSHF